MKQYEQVWKSKNKKYYERTRDSETQEVQIKEIHPTFELFEQSNNPDSPYKFILDDTIKLDKKTFSSEKEYKTYLGVLDSVGRTVYGTQQPVYAYIRDNYFGNGITLKPRIWHLDIEVIPPAGSGFPDPKKADYPVTSFQIYDNYLGKNILLINQPLNDEESFHKRNPDTIVKVFDDEKKMFESFVKLLDHCKPSIINAWNGENFDIPYITNRAKKINGFNYRKLSPIGVISEKEINGEIIFTWEGLTLVDTMLAYMEFTYTNQASYALDNIAKEELGIGSGKVSYGKYKDIIEFHAKDYDRFMDYAVQDVQILKKLEEKLNLMQLLVILSSMMGINPSDAFGTVKPWGTYITNKAYGRDIIMPKDTKHHLDESIVGGFVAEPQRGIWRWIASIDINSMYPLLGIVAHNMSAEKYVPFEELSEDAKNIHIKYMSDEDEVKFLSATGLKEDVMNEIEAVAKRNNYSFGMNAFFKNDEIGMVPEIIQQIYSDRKIAKNKMLTFKALRTNIESRIEEMQ